MDCRERVSFEQILDFAEGRLAGARARRVQEHLALGCQPCQQSLEWCRRVPSLMQRDPLMLADVAPLFSVRPGVRCARDFEELADYVEGRLPAARVLALDSHLASSCPQCEQRIEWLQGTRILMAYDETVEPPAAVLQRAKALFSLAHPRPRASQGILERLVASLSAVGNRGLALAPVRGVASAATRKLFVAGDWQVDVECEQRGGTGHLMGQVLRQDIPQVGMGDLDVALWAGELEVARTLSEPTGEFEFLGLPSGRYDLKVTAERTEVIVEGLEL